MALEGYRKPHRPCRAGLQAGVRRTLLRRTRDFAHQLHDISFRVAESHHPQIVGWHWRDQARRGFDFYAKLEKLAVRGVDFRNPEVEDGARMIQLRRFRRTEAQEHSAAIKESQVARREQQWQTERVTVTCRGARQVVNNDGDLADILDVEGRRSGAHG